MIYDVATQRHKGFAFVEFETPEAAHMAIEDMQVLNLPDKTDSQLM